MIPTTGREARRSGAPKYHTGKPCKRGHLADRYAHNGQCVQCGVEATAAYRKEPAAKIVSRRYYESYLEGRAHVVMMHSARMRARRRGVPFAITADDILSVWPADNICPILGIKMQHNFDSRGTHADASPSLDCINPGAGYVSGNIVVCSFLANRIKNSVTDPAIFRHIADWLDVVLCVKGA